jgi:UDP-glucose 4-epimerase
VTSRVLVTGSEGFIGRALCRRLESAGDFEVLRCDRKLGWDCADPGPLEYDCVYHLAANSDISRGAVDPWPDFEATVQSTFWLLEDVKTRRIVYLSGSGVYGDTGGDPVTEHHPVRPVSAYGAAKASAEAWLSYWTSRRGATATVLRPCNIVGPGMTHGAVYDFTRALLERPAGPLRVLGDGHQLKPYLHVEDLVDAMLLEAPRGFSVSNVPGESMWSVRALAARVQSRLGTVAGVEYGTTLGGWPGDVPCVRISGGERLRLAGWAPKRTAASTKRWIP